jgi:hypothetical protein
VMFRHLAAAAAAAAVSTAPSPSPATPSSSGWAGMTQALSTRWAPCLREQPAHSARAPGYDVCDWVPWVSRHSLLPEHFR